jgi:IclR family transcriptional regulator, pca regulon regulatory protein
MKQTSWPSQLAKRSVSPADWIDGAAKSLAVLESFTAQRQRLSVSQVAQRAGLTRAAARRHVLTLQALGYLESDGYARNPSYCLGHRVLRLAGNYLASARLPRVVQPTLNRLAQHTGLAFSVAVLDEASCVIVARSGEHRNSSQVLPYGIHLGARLAAHATSTGQVLLAALSKEDIQTWLTRYPLTAITPHTLTSKAAFKARLAQVVAQTYAQAHEEHESGVHALAVPLHDANGQCLAALNAVLPAQAASPKHVAACLPVLQSAASELRLLL